MTSKTLSYPSLTRDVSALLAPLRANLPQAMAGFRDLSQGAMEEGAITAKTKELMALALGIAAHCDACIGFHVKALVRMGATLSEIEETVAVAVYMGGGPSLMYGAGALAAYDQFMHPARALSE